MLGTMAIKTYISRNTVPHFSVGQKRVAFHATTMGKAYFVTDDESLQKGIEHHPWFNKKFVLDSVEDNSKTEKKNNNNEAGSNDGSEKEVKEMHFVTLADAKSYLAQEFGVVRSNIKTMESAILIGLANGVKIVFDK